MKDDLLKPEAVERLSSRLTFFYKYVFPTVWITGFGIGTLVILIKAPFTGPADNPEPALRIVFPLGWIVGSSLLYWFASSLKRVDLLNDTLVLSNYRTEVQVPLAYIRRIRASRFFNPPHVILEFRSPTPFGQAVRFIPRGELYGWLSRGMNAPLPVAKKLRQRVEEAGGTLE